jgi:hypothetical protein
MASPKVPVHNAVADTAEHSAETIEIAAREALSSGRLDPSRDDN